MEESIESLLTVGEVMKVLRISRPTLYRMLRSSKLQPVKIGKRTLFEVKDIKALIERSKGGAGGGEQETPIRAKERKGQTPRKKKVQGEEKRERKSAVKQKRSPTEKQREKNEPAEKEGQAKSKKTIEDDKQGRLL